MSWLKEFPSLGSEQLSAVRRAVDGAFRSFTREHGETMERLFDPLREFLLVSERLLTQSPWPLVVGGIALIAWLASRSMKIVIGTVLTLLAIGYFGMWDDTMKTISMIFVSTVVALVAGTLTCLIGATIGLLAGFLRGWVDVVISRAIDIWMAFPPVLFSILLIAVMGPGLQSIILAIVVIDWTRFARVVRAEAMAQGAMDYVASAQVAGRRRLSTMVTEILPNVLPTIVVLLTLEMGIAVIVEAILSFVNLSISTDDPTWGGMIAEGRTSIHQAWWVLVFPLVWLVYSIIRGLIVDWWPYWFINPNEPAGVTGMLTYIVGIMLFLLTVAIGLIGLQRITVRAFRN